MSQSINTFIESVSKRNPNEPEFMQAVKEVAETVIPFIEENKKYQGKMDHCSCVAIKVGSVPSKTRSSSL